MTDTISMSSLVQIIKDIRSGSEKIEYILMSIDDFIEMMRNDDLRDETNTINQSYENELLQSNEAILSRSLCILGISIRTSEYVPQGSICKVLTHMSIR